MELKNTIGKILYGATFVVLLPFLLFLWADSTEQIINLPPIIQPYLGIGLSISGFLMILIGMLNLWTYGKGLPMNAFPPQHYVISGLYRLMPHPIYVGACLLSFGISIFLESVSGFWLISPLLVLACIALVMGYEKEAIEKIFGKSKKRHLLNLPENNTQKPSLWDRFSIFLLIFLPWAILYELVILAFIPDDAISTYFSFESQIPVIEWTEIIYFSTYLFVIFLPFLIKQKNHLRDFGIDFLLATAIGIFIQSFIPFQAIPQAFEPSSFWGELLLLERSYDSPAAAFPSFHVALSFITWHAYKRVFPQIGKALFLIPIAISISCITTGMHSLVDIIGGIFLYLLAVNRMAIWRRILIFCETTANSWKAWQWGSIRIINHGIYAGVAGFAGILIVGFLLGESYLFPILLIAIASILGAGLWAQIIEGNSGLSRPFGYYGSIIGGIIGIVLVSIFTKADFFLMLGAFAVSAPWVQAIGRMRCLVQGCCHGKHVSKAFGIKHFHEKSRVCTLSDLKGESLHPTPLYSIISNIIIGIILGRLWYSQASLPLIAGIYLILSNLYRFVEEAFRGEPQTPIWNGLRLYQWTALIGVLIGGMITCIQYSIEITGANMNWQVFLLAFSIGFICFLAMGVDFPNSNRRFSRLAS